MKNKEIKTDQEPMTDQPDQIDHVEKVKELMFQVLDELTKAKGKGQLSGTIQLNLHKRVRDLTRTMWKGGPVVVALLEAEKVYKTAQPGNQSPGIYTVTASGTTLKPLTLTPDMFNPHDPLGKKKRLTIDPSAAPEERVHERVFSMLPDPSGHIRSDDVQMDERPLWLKIMDLDDDTLITQMGDLGALKSYINKNYLALLPGKKKIGPRARKDETLEKVRGVFDLLKAEYEAAKESKEKEEKAE